MKPQEFEVLLSLSFSIDDVGFLPYSTYINGYISEIEKIKSMITKYSTNRIYFFIDSVTFPIFQYVSHEEMILANWTEEKCWETNIEIKGRLLTDKEIFSPKWWKNKIIFFKDWKKEFDSLKELRNFFVAYMLIS